MPTVKIDLPSLTSNALGVVDTGGPEALTLAIVAGGMGVRPSALYTHVDGVTGLRQLVAATAAAELTDTVRNAAVGRAGDDAVYSVGHAYRGYALDHPGRYACTLLPAAPDEPLAVAIADLHDVFCRVAAGYGLPGDEADQAAYTTRSAIHGFVTLEAANTLPPDAADERFEHLLATIVAGYR